jgi:hypothetical protein
MQAENIQYICLPDNIFQALNAGCFKEFFCDFHSNSSGHFPKNGLAFGIIVISIAMTLAHIWSYQIMNSMYFGIIVVSISMASQ